MKHNPSKLNGVKHETLPDDVLLNRVVYEKVITWNLTMLDITGRTVLRTYQLEWLVVIKIAYDNPLGID